MTEKVASKERVYLPVDYVPSSKDIVCGRGKAYSRLEGNQRFLNIVKRNLSRYSAARKRIDKSIAVISVVQQVLETDTKFLRYDGRTRRYLELNEDEIHEKTGHAIRDLLKRTSSDAISKSSKSKDRRRKRELPEARPEKSISCGQKVDMVSPNSILQTALEISDVLLTDEPLQLVSTIDLTEHCIDVTPPPVESLDSTISAPYRHRLTNGGHISDSLNEESRLLLRSLLPGYKNENVKTMYDLQYTAESERILMPGKFLNHDELSLEGLFDDM